MVPVEGGAVAGGTGTTRRDACKLGDCVGLPLSVTEITKEELPDVVGIPARIPVVLFNPMPAGRVPEEMLHR